VEHVTRGTRAFLGTVVALVGVMAARTDNTVLKALYQAMPQIADAIPPIITARNPSKLRHVIWHGGPDEYDRRTARATERIL
jgi:hypothetical protein